MWHKNPGRRAKLQKYCRRECFRGCERERLCENFSPNRVSRDFRPCGSESREFAIADGLVFTKKPTLGVLTQSGERVAAPKRAETD